jgi:hypothetical protein
MAALLGDKAESIPLGLEDPRFVVEGFVDERSEHWSISEIHAFSSDLASRVRFTCKEFPPISSRSNKG